MFIAIASLIILVGQLAIFIAIIIVVVVVVGQLAMFEKIELLHRLYPTYLIGARMVAWLFFEDVS